MVDEPEQSMEQVIRDDGRYPPEAFVFLHEGLSRAVRDVHGTSPPPGQHHVSGPDLCEALRNLAIEKWGLLAPAVLGRWNIHATIDFGNMVYLLVNNNFMRKTDEDSIEDFRDVYDFEKAFDISDDFELQE
ncbi:MAG: hypothetical protein KGY99_03930 [Phycisphaerae bacterium]|nr:hypothetical protein [Phycisphaerae bacterium]